MEGEHEGVRTALGLLSGRGVLTHLSCSFPVTMSSSPMYLLSPIFLCGDLVVVVVVVSFLCVIVDGL